jgi:hypothetical protein
VQYRVRKRPAHKAALQQLERLERERRKGRQRAEESGDQEETPLRRQFRMAGQPGERDTGDQAAKQIGGEGAERDSWPALIEPERQPPAQPRAENRSDRDGGQ